MAWGDLTVKSAHPTFESPNLATPASNENSLAVPPPPPPPRSEPSTPLNDDHIDEDANIEETVSPIVPPPPPPRDEEDEEVSVKMENGNDSLTEVKSAGDVEMNTLTSELKRKLEYGVEDDSKMKKIKESDDIQMPKLNGVHKSEDVTMEDIPGSDANGTSLKKAVDYAAVKEEVKEGNAN